jgi:hypothetical protein
MTMMTTKTKGFIIVSRRLMTGNRICCPPLQKQPLSKILDTTKNHVFNNSQLLYYSTPTRPLSNPSSPFAGGSNTSSSSNTTNKKRKRRKFVPRKSAVQLTDTARDLFIKLLQRKPDKHGIVLDYHQSSTGEPRMVFSFRFVQKEEDLSENDECVPLQLNDDGTPKSPKDVLEDDEPKLYIHHNAFMKVLGAKVDVDMETLTPILYDKEGNKMDPNA